MRPHNTRKSECGMPSRIEDHPSRSLAHEETLYLSTHGTASKLSLKLLKSFLREWCFSSTPSQRTKILCNILIKSSDSLETVYGYIGLCEKFRQKHQSKFTDLEFDNFFFNNRIDLLLQSLKHKNTSDYRENRIVPSCEPTENHTGTLPQERDVGAPENLHPYTSEDDYERIVDNYERFEKNGCTVAVFVKNAIPEKVRSHAGEILLKAAAPTNNRRRLNNGDPPNSGIVGYFDYLNTPTAQKCRLTAFSRANENSLKGVAPFVKMLDKVYQEHSAKHYSIQKAAIPLPVRFFDTVFSTLTVNDTFRTALHRDQGDLKDGLACVTVLDGNYAGLYLGVPELKVAFDIRPGDVLLFNSDLLHGNTEPRCEKWNRLSVVAYLRTNLFSSQCMRIYDQPKIALEEYNSAESKTLDPAYENEAARDTDEAPNVREDDSTKVLSILHSHQKTCFDFAYRKLSSGVGALVSLAMGLGKTLVAFALCNTFFHQTHLSKVLVICPCVVIPHWLEEYNKWAEKGYLSFPVFSLSQKQHTARIAALSDWDDKKGVMICGYEKFCTLNHREQRFRDSIKDLHIAILDEGHRLREKDTQIYAHLFSIPTKRRVVLSGTPMQNNLSELFNLLKWTDESLLPTDVEFRRLYTTPLSKGLHPNATPECRVKATHSLLRLQSKILSPISVRHCARNLPPKNDLFILMNPSPLQMELFRYFRGNTLPNSTACSYIAAHPQLLLEANYSLPMEDGQSKVDHAATLKHLQVECRLIQEGEHSFEKASPKLTFLHAVLQQAKASKKKVVIFSKYTTVLDLIQHFLQTEDFFVLRIDGSTKEAHRQEILREFKNAPVKEHLVLLLSIKATGIGIDLSCASIVILFEPTFNPTVENQAVCRVHRFGQKNTVTVYRLLLNFPQELNVFEIQAAKHQLNKAVFDHIRRKQHAISTSLFASSMPASTSSDPVIEKISREKQLPFRVLPAEELLENVQPYFTRGITDYQDG